LARSKYLLFTPWYGNLGNQIVAIACSLSLARALDRVLVLSPIQTKENQLLPFSMLFDTTHLQTRHPAIEWSTFQMLVLPALSEPFPLLQVRASCARGIVVELADDPN